MVRSALGAGVALASTGKGTAGAAVVMAVFSLGAVTPLIAAGLLSRSAFARVRERLLSAGNFGKKLMGFSLLLIGLLVLSGFDKTLEAWLLDVGPAWLTDLTVRY